MKIFCILLIVICSTANAKSLRIATFNVSMEAGNYIGLDTNPSGYELFDLLAKGKHPQIRNIAEIIQRVRPDIVLLNEFDYTADPKRGVEAFKSNFLQVGQNGAEPIRYPHHFVAPVNTGVESEVALNHSRNSDAPGNDTFGFGLYPGQYGMVLLSRFPIDKAQVRTFQQFLWKDMSDNKLAEIKDEKGLPWYSEHAISKLRLSSKSHWDIPVKIDGKSIHILASHPTPPVFDGDENRNGLRNHDEIRFWLDYIGDPDEASYIYDDKGKKGGLEGQRFAILGDLNASPNEGDAFRQPISSLISNDKVSSFPLPSSSGGKEHTPESSFAKHHTAAWRMTVDYVIPSRSGMVVEKNGIFWPQTSEQLHRLVQDRAASSDHRLVWVDVRIVDVSQQ